MFDKPVDQLLFDFNLKPAEYIHESWLTSEEAALCLHIPDSNGAARGYLSAWALTAFNLEGRFDFDFAAAEKRLLLLDPTSFRELVLMVGLCCLRRNLRKRIVRADVLRVRECLGEEVSDFFYDRVLPWPSVMHVETSSDPLSNLLVEAVRAGTLALRGGLEQTAAPSAERAALKLPKLFAFTAPLGGASPDQRQRTLEFCIDAVVRHRLPQWHWLF